MSFQKILLGFSPQLHVQSTSRRCLQVIPLWSAPLAPPHSAKKLTSIGEYWMVIGQCKKSARVWLMDQSHGPYISCCSHQNCHNFPCFGSSNSSVATFLGEFQYDMASKQPAVIEVPDDDFPDSGPQNPVEAQSYRDQLNAIMSTFSDLLADDRKDTSRSTVTSLKKIDGEALVTDGQSWRGCGPLLHSWLQLCLSVAAPHHWRCRCGRAKQQTSLRGGLSSGSCLKKVWKTEVWELIVMCFNHLSEVHTHMSSFTANMSSLAKITDPKTFDMVMEAVARPMIQVNIPEALPESSPRSTPEDHSRRMPVPAGKSHPPPAHISHTGTTVSTHQASSCSSLAPSQIQVFQWRHHQGSLHYVWGVSQTAVKAVVW